MKMFGRLSAQWFVVPAVCALAGGLGGVAEYFFKAQRGEPVGASQVVFDQVSYWFLWALLSPLILTLARRFPPERPRVGRGLLVHLLAAVGCAVLSTGFYVLLLYLSNDLPNVYANQFQGSVLPLVVGIIPNAIIYWIFLGITLLVHYQRQYKEESLKASELAAQLAEARLQALKMQLHPHFLFNTLHSISALVLKEENRRAVKMINRLSEFLRLTLERGDWQTIALADELEFAERYLEIERIRFQDRLQIQFDVDPQTLCAAVPNLILQPLVENAVRHGIAPRSEASRIEIVARRLDGQLFLEVRDDGGNLKNDAAARAEGGLGLKNTAARLAQLYGANGNFDLFVDEANRTTAKIVLPFAAIKPARNGAEQ